MTIPREYYMALLRQADQFLAVKSFVTSDGYKASIPALWDNPSQESACQ